MSWQNFESADTNSRCLSQGHVRLQGWRIEIKAYPKLTEFGSWRGGDLDNMYGGFYTQEQARLRNGISDLP